MSDNNNEERRIETRLLFEYASKYNWKKMLQFLEENPFYVNFVHEDDTSESTALHYAVEGKAPLKVVARLLVMGADPAKKNRNNETPYGAAKRLQLKNLKEILNYKNLQWKFSGEFSEREAVGKCALRFDGYKYLEWMQANDHPLAEQGFPALTEFVVNKNKFHDQQNDNFASFFALQRFLGKWGGEYNSIYSAEYIVYHHLFLHLYHIDVPEMFQMEEYHKEWERNYKPRREEIAQLVMNSFQRKGWGLPINL